MIGGKRDDAHGLVLQRRLSPPPGVGDGRVFVLLHGLGMSHRSFARLVRELARHSTVVVFDLPGFGRLGRPRHPVSVSGMAERIAAELDEHDLRDSIVIGQSMGTQWAAELAVRRPDLVASLVLIGPVVDDERRTLRAQLLALVCDSVREPPWVNAVVVLDYALCGPPWFLRQARAMLRYRIEDALRSIDAPVLIIRGDRDPIAGRAWCRRLRGLSSRSSLVTIPGGSHHAQQSAPRAVAAAVRAFVAGI